MAGQGEDNRTYRMQTEEDLKVAPMSTMQKVILGVAAAAVVAFVVYIVFFQ